MSLRPIVESCITVSFCTIEIPKKVFGGFDNVFHVCLMRGFQKYEINQVLTMAFWATWKIAQPLQPIWRLIFTLPYSALKKPSWGFNFFHTFGNPSSSTHEKCCQIFQTLFWVFQYSRNSQWHVIIYVFLYYRSFPVELQNRCYYLSLRGKKRIRRRDLIRRHVSHSQNPFHPQHAVRRKEAFRMKVISHYHLHFAWIPAPRHKVLIY